MAPGAGSLSKPRLPLGAKADLVHRNAHCLSAFLCNRPSCDAARMRCARDIAGRRYPPPPFRPGVGGGCGLFMQTNNRQAVDAAGNRAGPANGARADRRREAWLSTWQLSSGDQKRICAPSYVTTWNLEPGFRHCATTLLSSRRDALNSILTDRIDPADRPGRASLPLDGQRV